MKRTTKKSNRRPVGKLAKFPVVTWDEMRFVAGKIVRGDRMLYIALQEGPGAANKRMWGAVAVEGPARDEAKTPRARVNAFFDNHGHHLIGTFRTGDRALVAAEKYAAKWWRSRKSDKSCECEEIK